MTKIIEEQNVDLTIPKKYFKKTMAKLNTKQTYKPSAYKTNGNSFVYLCYVLLNKKGK